MAFIKKEKSSKRNFDKEAELQIKILEQKSREDYLTLFSQCEDSTQSNFGDLVQLQRRPETDGKAFIPPNAKAILEKWMYDHRLYCYPTKFEKQALSYETGLSVQKISNWFINSRRRTLPKVLETEGKSADNFTISRKKKNAAAVTAAPVNNCYSTLNDLASLSEYADQEELKIIDQNSIFYGSEFNIDIPQSAACYENVAFQEISAPCHEPDTQNFQLTYQAMAMEIQREEEEERQKSKWLHQTAVVATQQASEPQPLKSSLFASRGILYDETTKSKCIYIVVNSSN